MKRQTFSRLLIMAGCALTMLIASGTSAQSAPPATAASAPAAKPFKEDELASLLAPIALYPDEVIAQILVASTYPLEVVEANRWLQKNPSLKGEALAKEAKKQSWDPSVQGLTAIPDVLKMMDEKLDWTQKVGDAVLAQQKDVMNVIQKLRVKAQEAGNLKSDDHMKVSTQPAPATEGGAASSSPQVIVIESADPEVIYVPTYSPVSVYGTWGYPYYPPYYWPPPVGYPGSGFWWGVGIGISIGVWGGSWGHYPDWHGGDINIGEINIDRGDRNQINNGDRINANDRGRNDRGSGSGNRATATDRGGQKWSHNPEHRKGASYRDNATASKYGRGSNSSASVGSRDAYRGRSSSGANVSSRDIGSAGGNRAGASAGNTGVGSGSRGTSVGSTGSGSGSRGTTLGSSGAGSGSSSRYGGSGSGASTRSSGSSTRSSGSAFGGMDSGSRASSYGSRGSSSRGGGGMSRGGGGGRRR